MSNFSLPPSLTMWFVALSHRPHFPFAAMSVPLSLSFPQCEEDSSFLPSVAGVPQGNNRITSLWWLTLQHRELRSTPPSLQPRQPTSPHPGLDPSSPQPAWHYVSPCVFLVLLLFLYLSPLPGFLDETSRCLLVYTPSACLFFYQSSYSLSLLRSASAACLICQYTCLSVTVLQPVPWHSIAKSKHRRTQTVDSPVCILN